MGRGIVDFNSQWIGFPRRTAHILDIAPIGARDKPLPIGLNRTPDGEMSGTASGVDNPIDREVVAARIG